MAATKIFYTILDFGYTLTNCEVHCIVLETSKAFAISIIILSLSAVWLDPTHSEATESCKIIRNCCSEILKESCFWYW